MLFNSVEYLIFFPVVALLWFTLPRRVKNPFMLAASYFFYASWNIKYLSLIVLSTLVTYLCGLTVARLDESGKDEKRTLAKLSVGICLAINFGILFFFKYFNFLIDNINRYFGGTITALDVLLPVGISFFTFQAVGYVIDVYRKDVVAERSFITYALFVAFFPQLVAGPIERSANLLGQFYKEHKFSYEQLRSGFTVILWGLFQKLVIADKAAVAVNSVYNSAEASGASYLIASVLFAIQIYCDFGGYSLIAIGSARVLGFTLMENFNAPYLASGIRDFWSRWHISLSTWFRDYLYIPLGGSRRSPLRSQLNVLIVFVVSGLWHGASWHFVVWGFVHGILQVAENLICKKKKKDAKKNPAATVAGMAGTFILVVFTWIFFRAQDMSQALYILKRIASDAVSRGLLLFSVEEIGLSVGNAAVLAVAILLLLAADILKYRGHDVCDGVTNLPTALRFAALLAVIFSILVFGEYGPGYSQSQFIYFQF